MWDKKFCKVFKHAVFILSKVLHCTSIVVSRQKAGNFRNVCCKTCKIRCWICFVGKILFQNSLLIVDGICMYLWWHAPSFNLRFLILGAYVCAFAILSSCHRIISFVLISSVSCLFFAHTLRLSMVFISVLMCVFCKVFFTSSWLCMRETRKCMACFSLTLFVV